MTELPVQQGDFARVVFITESILDHPDHWRENAAEGSYYDWDDERDLPTLAIEGRVTQVEPLDTVDIAEKYEGIDATHAIIVREPASNRSDDRAMHYGAFWGGESRNLHRIMFSASRTVDIDFEEGSVTSLMKPDRVYDAGEWVRIEKI